MAIDQIEEIKKKTDIVEIISAHVDLKKSGSNFKGLCPFHSEKTPSFMVSPELQIFKCFGCGAGGDVYKFLMEFEKIEFPEALKFLAEKAGVRLETLKNFPRHQEKEEIYRVNNLLAELYHYLLISHKLGIKALDYLHRRGIEGESIKIFKLGFAPDSPDTAFRFLTLKRGYKPEILEKAGVVVKREGRYFDRFRGRIIFPLRDQFGNALGFSGRVLEPKGDAAKYINGPDTLAYKKGRVLYGLETTKQEIKRTEEAVVVEGEFDVISSWQAGIKNVVGIKGSSLTEDQVRLLSRFCPAISLALDSDFAGSEAARKAAGIAQNLGLEVRVIKTGEFKDPDEMVQKKPEEWRKAVGEAIGVYDFLLSLIFDRFDPGTSEGKSKISKSIAPILAGIEDEIVRAHYIKQAAIRLGVPEEAVLGQVSKEASPQPQLGDKGQQIKQEDKKTRREVLEEYLLALVFQNRPEVVLEIGSVVSSSLGKRLIGEFERFSKENENFDPSIFASSLPPELVNFFATLVLSDLEELATQGKIDQEIQDTKKALEVLETHSKMNQLAQEIRVFEDQGEIKKVKELEEELTRTGERLSLLQQQD